MKSLMSILAAAGMSLFMAMFFDFKVITGKRIILLLLFFIPSVLFAQYRIGNSYNVSFKYLENQKDKLEYTDSDITFNFIPNDDYWEISITNNSTENVTIDWKNVLFITRGQSSAIIFKNKNSEQASDTISVIKEQSSISREIAPQILHANKQNGKIFDKQELKKKGHKSSASITVPLAIDGNQKKYLTFDFVIEYKK
ncbi:hypothetical protein [uncultured Bacteroides sp.]|uniref:hypothetical protein n=1 Tax=uncultured Bacteroides sp. TaxID=162156 RepID=UPI002AA65C21|nr:hypothetical protein [uncultured Bacteroides sp.]